MLKVARHPTPILQGPGDRPTQTYSEMTGKSSNGNWDETKRLIEEIKRLNAMISGDEEKRITYKDIYEHEMELQKIKRIFGRKKGSDNDRILYRLAKRVERQIAEFKELLSKHLEEDAAKEWMK